MSEPDKRAAGRVPVVLRIKLQHPDVDTFIEKFATNISRGGMFIASRTPKPVGTGIRFELRLANDSPVIAGSGVVRWIRDFDPKFPRRAHGMGIQFSKLDPTSRDLLERIVDHRRRMGLPDEMPAAPPAEPPRPPPKRVETRPPPPPAPPEPPPAPRHRDIPPLAPRPPRRPAVDLASALAQVTAGREPEGADAELGGLLERGDDLSGALRRAHELAGAAGRGPDREDPELAELLRVAAAPVAETVDDASAKLAMMLGGAPVRTRRGSGPNRAPAAAVPIPQPAAAPPRPADEDTPDAARPVEAADDGRTAPTAIDREASAARALASLDDEATDQGDDEPSPRRPDPLDDLPIDLDADALDPDQLMASDLDQLTRRSRAGDDGAFSDSTEVPALPPIPGRDDDRAQPITYDPAVVLASAPEEQEVELDERPTGVLPAPIDPVILRHAPGAPPPLPEEPAPDDEATAADGGERPDGDGAPKKKGFLKRIFGKG